MNKELLEQRKCIMINNTLRIMIFGVLSIVFNKWWIVLFSALFLIYERKVKNEKIETDIDVCQKYVDELETKS